MNRYWAQQMSVVLMTICVLGFSSCSESGGVNLFTIEDDKALGAQLRDEILSDTSFTVLDRNVYLSSYEYLEQVVSEILNSGEVEHKDDFPWEVYLVQDDSTLNAFAAPGGYIFVYTGLIKFLESKDDFVGVMGHEMAHVDLRHSTQQLTQQYGLGLLLNVLSGGEPGELTQILGSLVGLKFSRDDESQADRFSVLYLCETPYAANGAGSFFEKLSAEGNVNPPAFLSTHPNPADRVQAINQIAQEQGCDTISNSSEADWENFQGSLPN